MTYNDLKCLLIEFTDAQLEQTVTVYVRDQDEFRGVNYDDVMISDEQCDVLDPGHKYIVI